MLLKSISKIIQDYMDLKPGTIWLRNEKITQTKEHDFNITVGFMSIKPIGTSTRMLSDNTEEVSSSMAGVVVVEIYGRTFEVVTRKEEIIQAFCSTASKEAQVAGAFLIAQIPSSFNDISSIDGAAIPYRFQMTLPVQFITKKVKNIDYYDKFRSEVIL
jgi:hypothetical protein